MQYYRDAKTGYLEIISNLEVSCDCRISMFEQLHLKTLSMPLIGRTLNFLSFFILGALM